MTLKNDTSAPGTSRRRRHPDWLKIRLPGGAGYERLRTTMRGLKLHTVCEEASCPNVGECWGRGTATFMLLGDICTRGCRYCAVAKGRPVELDFEEPARVAEAAARMRLRHIVLTSVDRDDLKDGGAAIFAATIEAIHRAVPGSVVEVLIPDFRGRADSLQTVLDARPEVLNHNIETVRRLFPRLRPGGDYDLSIELLRRSLATAPSIPTKSGMMLGMGESDGETLEVMRDLRAVGVTILTLGQYLQPTRKHAPIDRYLHPDEFADLRRHGDEMGFAHVEAGPLVRSSYHAEKHVEPAAEPAARGRNVAG